MAPLRILKKKSELTTVGLLPSSSELYDLMHMTSCIEAAKKWGEEWSFCPVCLARYDENGMVLHRPIKEILN